MRSCWVSLKLTRLLNKMLSETRPRSHYKSHNFAFLFIYLDLNSLEENSPQCPSIILSTLSKRNQSRTVSLISEHKFHLESLQFMLETAADGCAAIQKVLEAEIKRTLESRRAGGSHSNEDFVSAPGVTVDLNLYRGTSKAL